MIIETKKEGYFMDKEKIIKIVTECLQTIINNEGGLQSTTNADCAINWNYQEIEEIIEKHLTNN